MKLLLTSSGTMIFFYSIIPLRQFKAAEDVPSPYAPGTKGYEDIQFLQLIYVYCFIS